MGRLFDRDLTLAEIASEIEAAVRLAQDAGLDELASILKLALAQAHADLNATAANGKASTGEGDRSL